MAVRPSLLLVDSEAALVASLSSRAAAPVVVLNLALLGDSGLALVERIRTEWPGVGVIASGVADERWAVRCIEAGCDGVVELGADSQRVYEAAAQVLAGQAVCPSRFAHGMFVRLAEVALAERSRVAAESLNLTQRQLQIVKLIAQGLNNHDIAARLFVTKATVKNHVHLLLRKLRGRDRRYAVLYAEQHGWLEVCRNAG
jgi:DNA-binding NarL/FixJ family response regulator